MHKSPLVLKLVTFVITLVVCRALDDEFRDVAISRPVTVDQVEIVALRYVEGTHFAKVPRSHALLRVPTENSGPACAIIVLEKCGHGAPINPHVQEVDFRVVLPKIGLLDATNAGILRVTIFTYRLAKFILEFVTTFEGAYAIFITLAG